VSLRRVAPGRYGHLKGKERLEQTIRWVLVDLRIPFLTVYALSQENFAKRTPEVLSSLVQSPTAPCAPLRAGHADAAGLMRLFVAGARGCRSSRTCWA
jgi:undecaprenyl pyrophosphate synthase